MSARPVSPAPNVRLTIGRVVVRGAEPPSSAALAAAIERAVATRIAESRAPLADAAAAPATAIVRARAADGSAGAIAEALAAAVARGLEGGG